EHSGERPDGGDDLGRVEPASSGEQAREAAAGGVLEDQDDLAVVELHDVLDGDGVAAGCLGEQRRVAPQSRDQFRAGRLPQPLNGCRMAGAFVDTAQDLAGATEAEQGGEAIAGDGERQIHARHLSSVWESVLFVVHRLRGSVPPWPKTSSQTKRSPSG